MTKIGVIVECEDAGYAAYTPAVSDAYGQGPTPAAAIQHLCELLPELIAEEPKGLWELLDQRDLISVQAHIIDFDLGKKPRFKEQRLSSISDIAHALGVSRQTVWNWTQRYDDFPIPLAQTSAGPFWSLEEVKRWKAARRKPQKAG